MKFKLAGAVIGVGLALASSAFGDGYKVGDRVLVGSINQSGTVIVVGDAIPATGGVNVKVHLDSLPPGYPTVGAWYDTALSHVTVTGNGPPPGGLDGPTRPAGTTAANTAGQPGATAPQAPAAPRIDPNTQTHASAALCKQLIVDNYPPGGADQTITVNFLNFTMGGPRSYEAVYANDLAPPAGRGHTVSASPIHTKFTVLTHYADPQADDELRTYDAQYMCYRLPVGGWVVEMTSRVPGGEEARYIKKG